MDTTAFCKINSIARASGSEIEESHCVSHSEGIEMSAVFTLDYHLIAARAVVQKHQEQGGCFSLEPGHFTRRSSEILKKRKRKSYFLLLILRYGGVAGVHSARIMPHYIMGHYVLTDTG